jgi:hypothetical protein
LLLVLLAIGDVLVVLGVLGYREIRHGYNPEDFAQVPALPFVGGVVILLALLGLSVAWVVFRLYRD